MQIACLRRLDGFLASSVRITAAYARWGRVYLGVVALLGATVSSLALGGTAKTLPVAAGSNAEVEFFVVGSNGPAIDQAEVLAVTKRGFQLLGRTDATGHMVVAANAVGATEANVVLVCHPRYFCGALRVDEAFLTSREHFIILAPFGMR